MRSILFIIVLSLSSLLFSQDAYAESTFSDLKKIPLKDVTEEFEHYLCTAKYNGYDLHLKIVNDEIVIYPIENYSKETKLDISSGTLYAYDYGEFGGKLKFVQSNAKVITKDIPNIKNLFKINEKIYAFKSLCHMAISEGQLLGIIPTTDDIKHYELLNTSAGACINYKDKIYIASGARYEYNNKSYYRREPPKLLVLENLKVKKQIILPSQLIARQILIHKNFAYITARSTIQKVNLTTNEIEYFLYTKRRK